MRPLAILLAFSLAACASTAELNREHTLECQSYGIHYGSHDWYDCRIRWAEMHERRQSAILNAVATGLVTATVGILAGVNLKAILAR